MWRDRRRKALKWWLGMTSQLSSLCLIVCNGGGGIDLVTRFRAGVTPAGYPPSKPATRSASRTTPVHYRAYKCSKYAEGIRNISLSPRLWLRNFLLPWCCPRQRSLAPVAILLEKQNPPPQTTLCERTRFEKETLIHSLC